MTGKKDNISLSLDIERGDGESFQSHSGASSSRNRPGSRAPSSASSASSRVNRTRFRNHKPAGAQIQILSDSFADDVDDDFEAWKLEDYLSGNESDSTLADSPDGDYRKQSYLLQTNNGAKQSAASPDYYQMQLVARDTSSVDINSDEENEIVNRIKAEITHQVKSEIKDELLSIQYKKDSSVAADEPDEDIDPMIKAALLQMRKYDRILVKRSKRERDVKRQRIALQHRLRDELAQIKEETGDSKRSRDEVSNLEKFLSLPTAIPRFDSHLDEDDNDFISEPVFTTQPPEYDMYGHKKKAKSEGASVDNRSFRGHSEADTESTTTKNTDSSESSQKRKRRNKKDGSRDFIQRNIDLAADAGNAIAMTDDEKNRLNELLLNLEELPENETHEETESDSLVIRAAVGEGYNYDIDNQKSMREIDKQLECLLGPDDYKEYLTEEPVNYGNMELFSRRHGAEDQLSQTVGEKALQETKHQRDLKVRLASIEQELSDLSNAVSAEIESPRLSNGQLQRLLDDCTRTLTRATVEATNMTARSETPDTARSSIYDNPPKLDNNTLQALLAQARSEGIKSRSQSRAECDEESFEVEREDHESIERPASRLISGDQMKELLTNLRSTSVQE